MKLKKVCFNYLREENVIMSFCGKCGAPLEEGSAFCGSCGAPVEAAQQPQYQQPQQPQYQQPQQPQPQQYQQPRYQQAPQPVYVQGAPLREKNGPGTAGMVLGIIAMAITVIGILCCSGGYAGIAFGAIFMVLALILTLPGIGLSIGGVAGHRNAPKGKAVTGLVLNGLLLVVWICLLAFGGAVLEELFRYF